MNSFDEFGEEAASIVANEPDGWEYLLTVALMKFVLRKPLRRWRELQDGVLVSPRTVLSEPDVFPWVQAKMAEAQDIVRSFTNLYSKELQRAWGAPGVEGDPLEIRDTILSIAKTCEAAVDWEAQIKFTRAPDLYLGLLDAVYGAVGHNLPRLSEATDILDRGLKKWQANPDQPATISHTVVFDVPPEWNARIEAEIEIIAAELGL